MGPSTHADAGRPRPRAPFVHWRKLSQGIRRLHGARVDGGMIEHQATTAENGEELERLVSLIYELLDAHYDTAQLASGLTADRAWLAHLEYLRALQLTGREVLALVTHSGSLWIHRDAR